MCGRLDAWAPSPVHVFLWCLVMRDSIWVWPSLPYGSSGTQSDTTWTGTTLGYILKSFPHLNVWITFFSVVLIFTVVSPLLTRAEQTSTAPINSLHYLINQWIIHQLRHPRFCLWLGIFIVYTALWFPDSYDSLRSILPISMCYLKTNKFVPNCTNLVPVWYVHLPIDYRDLQCRKPIKQS